MMDADLRYEKSRENAGIRQSMWLPTLKRTRDKLVLYHAIRCQNGQYRYTRDEMLVTLGWQWNERAKYFYTELTVENLRDVIKLWSPYRLGLNVSQGVRAWQAKNK